MVIAIGILLALLPQVNPKLVDYLPGSPSVTFKQHSGYFNVSTNQRLHYWFLESKRVPSEDPLFLWLTGGPGCSGLFSLLTTIGPFFANADGKTLRENLYSWNNKANLLILESPAGVGYSYSEDDGLNYDDEIVAQQNYNALMQFLKEFPQFKKHDFYVSGASYAGIYVPMLAHKILQHRNETNLNLKGLVLSNGCMDAKATFNTLILYFYYHGLIEEGVWTRIKEECCSGRVEDCDFTRFDKEPPSPNGDDFCSSRIYNYELRVYDELGINPYNLHNQCHTDQPAIPPESPSDSAADELAEAKVPCTDDKALVSYFGRKEVRDALHIPSHIQQWKTCNFNITERFTRREDLNIEKKIREAALAGVKVLLFYGDMDMACNFLIGHKFVHQLGCQVTTEKQPIYVSSELVGFRTLYGNIEFDVILGAGHMTPKEKPRVAQYLIDEFIKRPSEDVCVLNASPSQFLSATVALMFLFYLLVFGNARVV